METLRQYDYIVAPMDVDLTARATIVAMGNYVLHSAGEDANKHSLGVKDLNENNASWVLTRFAMELKRMPQEQERLRISTWVSEVGRLMTTRNFLVVDGNGETIVKAVSNWAMIDITERKPVDLNTLGLYKNMVQDIAVPIELPQRLRTPEGQIICEHKIVYSDIDFNRHANSMKYLEWVIDTLPVELLEQASIRRVDMNFIHEAFYGSTARIIADTDYNYEINVDENPICRIKLIMA